MEMNGLMNGLYRISEWIMRLAYINILWLVFTLLGLMVFGVFPATTGLFAVARKWRMGESDVAVFKTFWHSYKSEFFKANILGYIMVIIGVILYFDIRIVQSMDGWLSTILLFLLVAMSFFMLFFGIFLFPVLVHYKSKTLQYMKNAILVSIAFPFHTIMMIVTTIAYSFIIAAFPVLIPFFSVSVLITSVMFIAYDAFRRVEEKQSNDLQEPN